LVGIVTYSWAITLYLAYLDLAGGFADIAGVVDVWGPVVSVGVEPFGQRQTFNGEGHSSGS
jgi:hypothetical protein